MLKDWQKVKKEHKMNYTVIFWFEAQSQADVTWVLENYSRQQQSVYIVQY